jgi:hypothetical protein
MAWTVALSGGQGLPIVLFATFTPSLLIPFDELSTRARGEFLKNVSPCGDFGTFSARNAVNAAILSSCGDVIACGTTTRRTGERVRESRAAA